MTTGLRKTNDFCWINVITPESARAGAFFSKLFGWTYGDMPGVPGGRLIFVDGKRAGALMDLEKSQMPPGTPACVGVLIRVESADAAREKVIALGGKAERAFDALDNGRMVMCSDPNGAVFALWEAKKDTVIDVDSHAFGAPSWFDTLTTDMTRATEFYTKLFGWSGEDAKLPGKTYTVFKHGAVPIGGAMTITNDMGGVQPFWGTYFAVKSAATSAKLAAELGATPCIPATDIPGVGRFAMLKSPQGVSFYVLEYAA